jgi:hypothetical protein
MNATKHTQIAGVPSLLSQRRLLEIGHRNNLLSVWKNGRLHSGGLTIYGAFDGITDAAQ